MGELFYEIDMVFEKSKITAIIFIRLYRVPVSSTLDRHRTIFSCHSVIVKVSQITSSSAIASSRFYSHASDVITPADVRESFKNLIRNCHVT